MKVRRQLMSWLGQLREQIRQDGLVYAMALLLPGGSVLALGLWLYRRISHPTASAHRRPL